MNIIMRMEMKFPDIYIFVKMKIEMKIILPDS